MIKFLSMLKEIVYGSLYEELDITEQESNEQSDTTDISELESNESTEQPGQGLKILTPDQMLNRLPITLTQKKEIIHKNLGNQATNVFFVQIRKTYKTTL